MLKQTKKMMAWLLVFVVAIVSIITPVPTGVVHAYAYDIDNETPIGMQGFVGEFAINDPSEIVEIIVQFKTPPSVALRLAQEQRVEQLANRMEAFADFEEQALAGHEAFSQQLALATTDFEAQALSAHAAFSQQLGQIPIPFGSDGIEIFCQTHILFNGVHMRLPGGMVAQIAELPEVLLVVPHIIPEVPNLHDVSDIYSMAYETIIMLYGEGESCDCEEPYDCDELCDYEICTCEASEECESGYGFFTNPNLLRGVRDLLGIDEIHAEGITGRNLVIAVIDTGIYYNHPQFVRTREGEGNVRRGGTIQTYSENTASHGTLTVGAVLAMAPEADIVSIRRESADGSGMTGIGALEHAHSVIRADVIYTWGYGNRDPFYAFANAVTLAVLDRRNTSDASDQRNSSPIIVVAAHNRGPNEFTVMNPGFSPLGITVGAGSRGNDIELMRKMTDVCNLYFCDSWGFYTNLDIITGFSGRGPAFETYYIKPDIIATGICSISTEIGGGYRCFNGTSLASPLITGIVALMRQQFPYDEPHEIKARLMNTARVYTNPDTLNPLHQSVFAMGSGFVQPRQALDADTIVTVVHGIQVNLNYHPTIIHPVGNSRYEPFILRDMSSLSFGSVDPYNNIMPIQIENRGDEPQEYTLTRRFTNSSNPFDIVNLTFSEINTPYVANNFLTVTVPAGETLQVYAIMTFPPNAQFGRYEGFVEVREGGYSTSPIIARLPFAANFTERDRPTVTLPNVVFDGTQFSLEDVVNVSATSAFRSMGVLVVIYRRDSIGEVLYRQVRPINNASAGMFSVDIEVDANISTFDKGDFIEILVYRNGTREGSTRNLRQHLLNRQIIRPVIF